MSKALELADKLEKLTASGLWYDGKPAAAELRRLAAVEAERDALKLRDVSNILIDVVPGDDGMGREVYAQSTDQVVEKLTKLSEKCDGLQAERDALKAELDRIRALEPVAWRWPSEKSSVVEWRYTLDKTKPESEPLYTLEKP